MASDADRRTERLHADVMLNMMTKALTGMQKAVQALFLAVVFSALAAASSTLLALQVIRGL